MTAVYGCVSANAAASHGAARPRGTSMSGATVPGDSRGLDAAGEAAHLSPETRTWTSGGVGMRAQAKELAAREAKREALQQQLTASGGCAGDGRGLEACAGVRGEVPLALLQ